MRSPILSAPALLILALWSPPGLCASPVASLPGREPDDPYDRGRSLIEAGNIEQALVLWASVRDSLSGTGSEDPRIGRAFIEAVADAGLEAYEEMATQMFYWGFSANTAGTDGTVGVDARICAQRRPGREPRRHAPAHPASVAVRPDRSTKAGARTPATPARPSRASGGRCSLNEGRGANPGDTGVARRGHRRAHVRSTKAGARTPATQVGRRDARRARLPRSTKAGARTPATLRRCPRGRPCWTTLNEGRGANPGDTFVRCTHAPPCLPAQRRPGREPRRHVRPLHPRPALLARSTKAGARTPATLCIGSRRREGS